MFGKKGFTLIEILFVIVVIGILAAIVIPRLTTTAKTAKINACNANVANINTQIERYYFEEGEWPSSDLSEMLPPDSYDYMPDGLPICPYADAYVFDVIPHRITVHDHSGE